MTLPVPSLLTLSGAPSHPASLDRAALLGIDAQMEYVTGRLPLAGIAAALDNTNVRRFTTNVVLPRDKIGTSLPL